MAGGGEVKAREDTEIRMGAPQIILKDLWINTSLIIQFNIEVVLRARGKMIQITRGRRVMGIFWETNLLID